MFAIASVVTGDTSARMTTSTTNTIAIEHSQLMRVLGGRAQVLTQNLLASAT